MGVPGTSLGHGQLKNPYDFRKLIERSGCGGYQDTEEKGSQSEKESV